MLENIPLKGPLKEISRRYNLLGKKQKILIWLLVFAVLINLYINEIFMPRFKQLSIFKNKSEELANHIFTVKAAMPSLEGDKTQVSELKRTNKQFHKELDGLEKELPKSYRTPQLLGELAAQASGLKIEFDYIKPLAASEAMEKEYSRIDIELQFSSPYYDFLGYLNKLENLSSYLNIQEIIIEEMKESNFRGETTVTLIISALLNKEQAFLKNLNKEEKTPVLEDFFKRNLFVPESTDVKGYVKESKYVLSGITFSGEKSTAIINGEIYKIGDTLDNKGVIEQILLNMVIIKYGYASEVLILE